jgi:hypothetical protein
VFEPGSPPPRPGQRVTRVQPIDETGEPVGPVLESTVRGRAGWQRWFYSSEGGDAFTGYMTWERATRERRVMDVSPWIREAMR